MGTGNAAALRSRPHRPSASRRPSVSTGARASPGTQLYLLGGFELRRDGAPVELPLSPQRLLAFLALHERPLHRTFVAETIWMHGSPASASASLRTTLWRLGHPHGALIEATSSHLALAAEVVVDVRALGDCARRVLQRRTEPGDGETLCSGGDLLPDAYDDWLLIVRERFRQLRLHALEALCDELTAVGHFGAAAEAAWVALSCDPLRESSHRALVRIHLAEGNRGEALRQYDVYRRLIVGSLGLEPSEAMEALVRPLRSHRHGR
jgi:DNA-binding SARP family transcriptional activator